MLNVATRLLPKQRIRTLAQFQHVYAARQRIHSPCYVLYYRHNSEGLPRLGSVASKRNVRKAVTRNRAKRVAREVFRAYQQRLSAIDVIIVAKSEAATATRRELRLCLDKLFTQLIKHCASS